MVNEALSAIGATSELSATAQALQQALLEGGGQAQAQPSAMESDTAPALATAQVADTTPDTPSVLVALASRSQAARRGSGADQPEPTAPRAEAAHEVSVAAPSLAAMQATAPEAPSTLLATPALLSALQAGHSQPLWHGLNQAPADERIARRREGDASSRDDQAGDEPPGESPHQAKQDDPRPATMTTWQECLAQALKLHAQAAPSQALLRLAAAQWQRGRTVLLVAPRGEAAAERGWLYALRLSAQGVLSGERFDARLRWVGPRGSTIHWSGVRATKQQGLHLGRQLRVQSELPEADTLAPIDSASIEIRLGAQDSTAPAKARVVEVRVDAIARLWACLDAQWSVTVLACDHPLGEASP